jgi:hypothetical protein
MPDPFTRAELLREALREIGATAETGFAGIVVLE